MIRCIISTLTFNIVKCKYCHFKIVFESLKTYNSIVNCVVHKNAMCVKYVTTTLHSKFV